MSRSTITLEIFQLIDGWMNYSCSTAKSKVSCPLWTDNLIDTMLHHSIICSSSIEWYVSLKPCTLSDINIWREFGDNKQKNSGKSEVLWPHSWEHAWLTSYPSVTQILHNQCNNNSLVLKSFMHLFIHVLTYTMTFPMICAGDVHTSAESLTGASYFKHNIDLQRAVQW